MSQQPYNPDVAFFRKLPDDKYPMTSEINIPTAPNPLAVISDNPVRVFQTSLQANFNASQWVVGKHYPAEVVASLKDGAAMVKVADSLVRMQFPQLPEVGARLSLTLISTSPRAIFLLNPPETNMRSDTSAVLSSTAKLVDQLTQYAQHSPQKNTVTTGKTPLLNTPDVDTTTMSKALQTSVSSSGVFYESHLAQWAKGTLDVTELMKEPQANFSKNLSDHNPVALSKEATSIIQQQLQTMEQQRFAWQGELWPGQAMEWEVSRDAPHQKNDASEKTWQSAVKFELPQLGAVSAQLQLTGTRIKLTVYTEDASTTLKLQSHTGELVDALEGSGVKLDAFLIETKK